MSYQLMTRRHPFLEGESDPVKINARVLEEHPPDLKGLRPDLPSSVCDLVMSLMAKEPDSRPRTAWEVCGAIKAAGASYPIEKALMPKHLLASNISALDNLLRVVSATDTETSRIGRLVGDDNSKLRLILSHNHQSGTLSYGEGMFSFRKSVLWPSNLRRHALREFTSSKLCRKKELVRQAVNSDLDSPSAMLLRHLLSPCTVRKLSVNAARTAESAGDYAAAAELSLQAGDLTRACENGSKASSKFLEASNGAAAMSLLRQVVDYARMTGRLIRGSVSAERVRRYSKGKWRDEPSRVLLSGVDKCIRAVDRRCVSRCGLQEPR